MKKQLLSFLLVILSVASIQSQNNPYWIAGGNSAATVDAVNGTNNFLGTKAGNNVSLNLITAGAQRMTILGNGGGTNGFVGVGTGFAAPTSLLHLNDSGFGTFAQFTNGSTSATATDGFKVGVLGSNAFLIQQEAFPLNFAVNGATRQIILANGNVGIGNNFTSPIHLVDVRSGDINTGNGTAASPTGYMIGDNYVLRHKGDITNIFVGVGAGTSNTGGNRNTFVGNDAGTANTQGVANCVLGSEALFTNKTGSANIAIGQNALNDNKQSGNVAVGNQAMYHQTTAQNNVAIGSQALFSNVTAVQNVAVGYNALNMTTAVENTAVGAEALEQNVTGTKNSAFGDDCMILNQSGKWNSAFGSEALGVNVSGNNNTTAGVHSLRFTISDNNTAMGVEAGVNNGKGKDNVFLGYQAASVNTKGDLNTIVGYKADMASSSLNNAAAIGSNAIVTAKNKMILGDNSVNVGIGLSNDLTPAFGPQNKLEINADPASFSYTGVGGSGLRFRQLTANSPTTPNVGNMGVLALSTAGDVIYVPAPAGSNLGNICGSVTPNPLTNSWEIPLGTNTSPFNYIFSRSTTGTGKVGIGALPVSCNPGNLLEVSKGTTSNISGLRLTDLAGATGGTANGNVLSVDPTNGDVILVPDATGSGSSSLGGICGTSPAPLASNWEIPLGGNTFLFSGSGAVNIGNNSCAQVAKLYTENISNPFNYNIEAYGGEIAVYGVGTNGGSSTDVIGVKGDATSGGTNTGTGVYGSALGLSPLNIGVYGIASSAGKGLSGIGVWGILAPSSNSSIGGYFSDGGTHPTNYAGYFDGDVMINGTGSGSISGIFCTSDSMFKTNIDTIANPLAILKQLKPKTFFMDTVNHYGLNFNNKKQYGFIAQDVQTVLPELVGTATKPASLDTSKNPIPGTAVIYKTLNYNAFLGLLTAAMQKQQTTIDSLTAKYNQLASALDNCCQHHNNGNGVGRVSSNTIDVDLNNSDIIVLDQNSPNPFAEQTAITYNIPQNVSVAQILFYDINGRQIKAVDVTKKGRGQLNVYANDLTSGIYSYTLIADGKIIDTKKMIKQQ